MKLENVAFFLISNYGFSSSRSTATLLTVVADKIVRTFNISQATCTVALNM